MCDIDNTVSVVIIEFNKTICQCHVGYYGNQCENTQRWYRPIMITIYIIELIVMIFNMIWIALYLHYLKRKGPIVMNLSTVGLLLVMIGIILRTIYLVTPSRSVWGMSESSAMTLMSVALVYSVLSLWATAGLLIIGFWAVTLTRTLSTTIRRQTIIFVSILSGIVFVLSTTGMIVIIIGSTIVGSFLVIIPIATMIITLITYTVKISRNHSELSLKNKERKLWIQKSAIALSVSWSIYFLTLVAFPIFNTLRINNFLIILSATFRLVECGVSISLLSLFDVRFRALRRQMPLLVTTQTTEQTSKSRNTSNK